MSGFSSFSPLSVSSAASNHVADLTDKQVNDKNDALNQKHQEQIHALIEDYQKLIAQFTKIFNELQQEIGTEENPEAALNQLKDYEETLTNLNKKHSAVSNEFGEFSKSIPENEALLALLKKLSDFANNTFHNSPKKAQELAQGRTQSVSESEKDKWNQYIEDTIDARASHRAQEEASQRAELDAKEKQCLEELEIFLKRMLKKAETEEKQKKIQEDIELIIGILKSKIIASGHGDKLAQVITMAMLIINSKAGDSINLSAVISEIESFLKEFTTPSSVASFDDLQIDSALLSFFKIFQNFLLPDESTAENTAHTQQNAQLNMLANLLLTFVLHQKDTQPKEKINLIAENIAQDVTRFEKLADASLNFLGYSVDLREKAQQNTVENTTAKASQFGRRVEDSFSPMKKIIEEVEQTPLKDIDPEKITLLRLILLVQMNQCTALDSSYSEYVALMKLLTAGAADLKAVIDALKEAAKGKSEDDPIDSGNIMVTIPEGSPILVEGEVAPLELNAKEVLERYQAHDDFKDYFTHDLSLPQTVAEVSGLTQDLSGIALDLVEPSADMKIFSQENRQNFYAVVTFATNGLAKLNQIKEAIASNLR